jgi:hypothetical protein
VLRKDKYKRQPPSKIRHGQPIVQRTVAQIKRDEKMQIISCVYANSRSLLLSETKNHEALKGQLAELEIQMDQYLEELGYGA